MNFAKLFKPKDVAVFFAVFVAIYFPMLVAQPLTIDAELFMGQNEHHLYIITGRWATYLLSEFLLPPPVLPYFSIAFFGLMASIAYYLLLKACDVAVSSLSILGFAVFCSMPIWSYLLEFVMLAPSAGIALAITATCVFLLGEQMRGNISKPLSMIAQILLLAFAIGVYQPFVTIYAVMAIAMICLNPKFQSKSSLVKSAINIVVVSVLAVAVYFIIHNLTLWFAGLQTGYIGKYFRPDLITAQPLNVINTMLHHMGLIYGGTAKAYGSHLWPIPLIIFLAVTTLFSSRKYGLVLLLVAAFFAPFAFVFMAGGLIPYRTLIAIPVALWLGFMLASKSHIKWRRYATAAVSVVLVLQSAALISQYQSQRLLTEEFNQSLANEIYARIATKAKLDKPQKVDIYGSRPVKYIYPIGFSSSAGGSFFSWDGGNPVRMIRYMTLLGYQNLQSIPKQKRLELIPVFEQMPPWPQEGSVKLEGDVVLVKLGNKPGHY